MWGGDPEHTHAWADPLLHGRRGKRGISGTGGNLHPTLDAAGCGGGSGGGGQVCACGAWLGSLGLEPDLGSYIAHLCEILEEVKRVLHPEGLLFLNLGDGFAGSWGNQGRKEGRGTQRSINGPMIQNLAVGYPEKNSCTGSLSAVDRDLGLKPNDLCFMPHRVAMALQERGWWVRDEIVWAKNNCLPSSVKNRTTRQHEFIFMLTKQGSDYFYDEEPIREQAARTQTTPVRYGSKKGVSSNSVGAASERTTSGREYVGGGTRRPRSVWEIATQPLKEQHFASFAEKLVERVLLCGSSAKGACPSCGAQWRRVVEKGAPDEEHRRACGADTSGSYAGANQKDYASAKAQAASDVKRRILEGLCERRTVAWRQGCRCPYQRPVPSVVLDCFAGSCTTGLVAKRLGRRSIMIDQSAEYISLGKKRCGEGGQ